MAECDPIIPEQSAGMVDSKGPQTEFCVFSAADKLVGRAVVMANPDGSAKYVFFPLSGPIVDPWTPAAGETLGECDEERRCARSVDSAGNTLAIVELQTTRVDDGAPVVFLFGTNTPYTPGAAHVAYLPCASASIDHELVCVSDDSGKTVVEAWRRFDGTSSVLVDSAGLPLAAAFVQVPCGPPRSFCVPDPGVNLNAKLGAGETAKLPVIGATDAIITDDTAADALVSNSVWTVEPVPYVAPFPIVEPLRSSAMSGKATLFGTARLTSGTIDPSGAGWLRLTDATNNQAGGVIFNDAFPSTESVVVEFDYADYGGNGADGLSVFLLDGTKPAPTDLGAAGGGFGYATNMTNAQLGIEAGVVGIAFDEFGSFAGPQVGVGGTTNRPNSITVRGPGDADPLGYPLISTTPVTPQRIDGHPRSAPVHVKVSIINEAGTLYLTEESTYDAATGPVTHINRQSLAAVGTLPPTLRIGFGSATGGLNNVHEIRDLKVTPAGRQNWRAFTLGMNPLPACATSVRLDVAVKVTATADSQASKSGNTDPEMYLWLVNDATGEVVGRSELSSVPGQVNVPQTMTLSTSGIASADLPNLRVYVGSEARDQAGSYGFTWENLGVVGTAQGCPTTPIPTVPISAPCPIPVVIVGGSTGGGSAPVTSPSLLPTAPALDVSEVCATIDVAGTPTAVAAFRHEEYDPITQTRTIKFIGADGAEITPTSWTPGACPSGATAAVVAVDLEAICVSNDAGKTTVPGWRQWITSGAGVVSSILLDKDGAPLVAPWAQVPCSTPTSSTTYDHEQVCVSSDGGKTTTIAWRRWTTDAAGVSTSKLTYADGSAVPAAFVEVPCSTPSSTADATEILVCAEGGEYQAIRRVTRINGVETVVFITDGGDVVTPAVWSPGPCLSAEAQVDLEAVCVSNDGGKIVVRAWRRWSSTGGLSSSQLVQANGTALAAGYVEVDCGTTYLELEPVCVTNDAGVTIVRAWRRWTVTGGVLASTLVQPDGTALAGAGFVETNCSPQRTPEVELLELCDDRTETVTRAVNLVAGPNASGVITYPNVGGSTDSIKLDTGVTAATPVAQNAGEVYFQPNTPIPTTTSVVFPAGKTAVRVTIGRLQSPELLRNMTPTPTIISGPGVLTGSDLSTTNNGAPVPIVLEFPAGTTNVSWTWGYTGIAGGFQTAVTGMSYQEVVPTIHEFVRQLRVDPVTGVQTITNTELDLVTPYVPAGKVGVCSKTTTTAAATTAPTTLPKSTVQAHIFEALPGTPGTPWTPANIPAGTLVGLSAAVITGSGSITDADGTVVAGLPAGYTASWNVDDPNANSTLVPPRQIAAGATGSRVIVTMEVRV